MKKILLITLALTGLCANAQYFEHLYGTNQAESVSDAIVTQSGGDDGYFMVGTSANNGAGNPGRELVVARTAIDGTIGCATCFVKSYEIWNNISDAVCDGADHYTLNGAKCAERQNSTNCLYDGRFEVVTGIQVGSNNWLSYMELDHFGNIIYGPENIYVGGSAFSLGAITTSADETSLYITGNVTNTNQIFIIKYDITNHTITWANYYNVTSTIAPPLPATVTSTNEYATDIIEDAANNRVIVVGRLEEVITPGAFINKFGLILTADDATGNTTINADVYGARSTTASTENNFNSIKSSQTPGFIISGHSDIVTGNTNMWALRLSSALGVSWSKVVDYSYAALPFPVNDDERGMDIVERLNPNTSNYEYYQIGNVVAGNRTGSIKQDIAVYKLDANGDAIGAVGQFTYGDVYGDAGSAIDLVSPSDGFAIFGGRKFSSTASDMDFYAARAYFNGHLASTCTYYINTSNTSTTGHGVFKSNAPVSTSAPNVLTAPLFGMGENATETGICDGTNTTDGSNARVAPNTGDGDKYDNLKVGPNPTVYGDTKATLFIEAETAEQVNVALYDMLGKQIYTRAFEVKKGKNDLVMDLSSFQLAHGTYSIKISGTNTNQSRILIVE